MFKRELAKRNKLLGIRRERAHPKFSPVTIVMLIVLILYVASLFLLFFWAVLTAFKDPLLDFRTNTYCLLVEWVWNFSYVFSQFVVHVSTETRVGVVGMAEMYLYSFVYAGWSAFFNTLVPCITAYLCARFKYKFSRVVHTMLLITMVIPVVGSLPAEIRMAQSLGLYDQIWGMWILKTNFLGMYFLVFYNIFKALPASYTEAAKIDGAGNMSVLLRIALPLVRNTFFTVFLIYFIQYWNDYQTPLIYLPSYPTIAQGMYTVSVTPTQEMSYVPMRLAAAILMLVPILVIFLIFQKRLLGNLTVGGIKG